MSGPRDYRIPPPGAYVGTLQPDGSFSTDDQYLRRWQLTVFSGFPRPTAGEGLIITTQDPGNDFRMTFKIRHTSDSQPQTAEITVYNLADETAQHIIKAFDTVELMAGYMTGHYGVIFSGTIKQYKIGRESAIDSYLTIFAASGDVEHNRTYVSTTLAAGTDMHTTYPETALTAMKGTNTRLAEGERAKTLPLYSLRPVVLHTNAIDVLNSHALSTRSTWYFERGMIHNVASTGYRSVGDIPVINPGTGMIGVPEQTEEGISVRCLLNPNLYIKCRVQLDNRTFNRTLVPGGDYLSGQQGTSLYRNERQSYMAPITADGIYTIMILDMSGDTRGLDWYCDLVCTFQNPGNPADYSTSSGNWDPMSAITAPPEPTAQTQPQSAPDLVPGGAIAGG
jgi:hypothetical protein